MAYIIKKYNGLAQVRRQTIILIKVYLLWIDPLCTNWYKLH